MPITKATNNDLDAIETLLNSAYRGEYSKKGWTSEADLIDGQIRTDKATLSQLINTPGATFLKYEDDKSQLQGCVYLHRQQLRLYLGMLSVSPEIQTKGIGKKLMVAAEDYAREKRCATIFMKVISERAELIDWYERKGYKKTEMKEPFPSDGKFGKPVKELEFIIMEKTL